MTCRGNYTKAMITLAASTRQRKAEQPVHVDTTRCRSHIH